MSNAVLFWSKVILSSLLISFASWLAGKKPALAGFIVALPISSMLALALAQMENQNQAASFEFAKSIFAAIPLSLMFFVPILLASKFGWGFWMAYSMGFVSIGVGYIVHRAIVTFGL
ncbi:MAG: hypothetical protein IT289_06620 [Oligoflexia bacterium]|nr:hypothetical protein [Oligoflexia bacterium]